MSDDELQRRSLSREARGLATRIEEINTSLADNETRMAKLEVMFSKPEQFEGPTQIAASGEQYRVLKEETQSLWDEWERLSMEAEHIDSKLTELKAG